MLYSQGISLEELEIGRAQIENPREVWRIFASHYYLFRGTPTRLWLDYAFQELFGLTERLGEATADQYYDTIEAKLATAEFLPRALYERFNMEVLATTDSALDPLADHAAIRDSGWKGRIVPTFRPDAVVDPEFPGFLENLRRLGALTGENTATWRGYLRALEQRRRILQVDGRDGNRSRPPHGADHGSERDQRRGPVRAGDRRDGLRGGPGNLPRPDAYRDGAHERGGRPGDADPSRVGAQPQCAGLGAVRARHGRRHSAGDELCGGVAAAAGPVRQRARI